MFLVTARIAIHVKHLKVHADTLSPVTTIGVGVSGMRSTLTEHSGL
jgi:hypothetical protein